MIIKNLNIQKGIFTREELTLIEQLLQRGDYKHIMSSLMNITPEQEIEIQRIINLVAQKSEGFESSVRKQMTKKLPNGPQTPEEEAKWDRRLQTEYKEWLEAQEEKGKKIKESLEKPVKEKKAKKAEKKAKEKAEKEEKKKEAKEEKNDKKANK